MYLNEGSAVYARLAANSNIISEIGTATKIYERFVPVGGSPPYVMFFESSGRDLNETPRDERFIDVTVKGVSHSYTQAKRLAGYIRAALHGQEDSMSVGTGWEIYDCEHQTDVEYTAMIESKQEYNVGGIYRLRVNAT